MALFDSFPHECTIQKRVKAQDSLVGSKYTRTVIQTGVQCWEQAVSSNEMLMFEKRGMKINTKVFFLSNPGITDRHEIVITKRNGVSVPLASQTPIQDLFVTGPDASAGLGILFKVMGNVIPGDST